MTRPGQVNPWAAWLQANGPGRYQLASKTGWDAFANTAPRADLRVLTRAEVAALGSFKRQPGHVGHLLSKKRLDDVGTGVRFIGVQRRGHHPQKRTGDSGLAGRPTWPVLRVDRAEESDNSARIRAISVLVVSLVSAT